MPEPFSADDLDVGVTEELPPGLVPDHPLAWKRPPVSQRPRWYYEDGTPVPDSEVARIRLQEGAPGGQPAAPAARPGIGARVMQGLREQGDTAATAAAWPLYQPRTEPGRKMMGAREAATSIATGLGGWVAGIGSGLVSAPYYALRDEARQQQAIRNPQRALELEQEQNARRFPPVSPGGNPITPQSGREMRRLTEEALAYIPRTEEGMSALTRVAENPILNPPYLQRFEQDMSQRLGAEAGEALGLAAHPLNLLGIPEARAAVGAGVRGAVRPLVRSVREGGQRAALRALGPSAGAVRPLVRARGAAGMQELGQTLLDVPGARLREGARGVFEPKGPSPLRAAMDPTGARLAELTSAADNAGGVVDLGGVLQRFDAATQSLMKDPFARERLARVREYVAQSAQRRGLWTPQGRQLLHLSPSEAHAMRQGLDDVIYDAASGLRKRSPIVGEFNRLRRLVDDSLGEAMDQSLGAQVGAEWKTANRRYHNLADVQRLARAGYERQVGMEMLPAHGRELRVGGRRIPVVSRLFSVHDTPPAPWREATKARLSQALTSPFSF